MPSAFDPPCFVSLFREAGYTATIKHVPRIPRSQDQYYVADMFVSRMALERHPDALSQRAQDKVDKYREGYAAPGLRHAFLPAIVSTSGRIHRELLRLLCILANKRLPFPFRLHCSLRPHWMQPSLLFSVSLLFLLVRVALQMKLRSLRYHIPRL